MSLEFLTKIAAPSAESVGEFLMRSFPDRESGRQTDDAFDASRPLRRRVVVPEEGID